ncbi:MAG: ornithine cyclodeaminase family protein, partial [Kiloniellales bacterium]
MPRIKILTEADLRREIALDLSAVTAIEKAFAALATEPVVMPPILRLDIVEHHGEVDVKTAYVPGLDSFAIKISPGFFDNPKLGLPSLNGLMVLFSARTGVVEALLLDNGYLTEVRTAAAGAVAAKHLSRADSKTAAILGGGGQARLQLRALTLVRPIERARLWARRPEQAKDAAAALSAELGIAVEPAASVRAAVDGADIVVTTTPSSAPILEAAWLSAGQHVTAIGSDAEHKNEL